MPPHFGAFGEALVVAQECVQMQQDDLQGNRKELLKEFHFHFPSSNQNILPKFIWLAGKEAK
jgi:hypothetical protein